VGYANRREVAARILPALWKGKGLMVSVCQSCGYEQCDCKVDPIDITTMSDRGTALLLPSGIIEYSGRLGKKAMVALSHAWGKMGIDGERIK